MAWIESHQSLRNHPKIVRAARALGISRITMIGHMHCLWWWALDYAQDGDLSAFAPEDIAEAAEWDGDAEAFITALRDAARVGEKPGLLEDEDGSLVIHDWYDYAGKLIDKRRTDAERKRADRRKDDQQSTPDYPSEIQQTSDGHPMDVAGTVPYRTVPNSTAPNRTIPTEEDGAPRHATPASKEVYDAFLKARGGAVNPLDSEQVGELEALYGAPATIRAVEYCNNNRRQPFLSIGYIASTLAGWQKDDQRGAAHGRRNGSNGRNGLPVDLQAAQAPDVLRARYGRKAQGN